MKLRTAGITTAGLYAIVETHIMNEGPSTRDDICASHPELDREDVGVALRRLNGASLVKVRGREGATVYDIKRRSV